jgi:hypothetical protein
MASFEEILNRPSTEIKPPEAYPVGTYHCLVEGLPVRGKSSQKETPYLRFKFKILSPMQDVNGAAAAAQQVVGKFITNDYYITDAAAFMLSDNLLKDSLGIDGGTPENPKALHEMIAESPGKQLLVKLKHDASQDGKRVFHRVDSTAHV